MATSPRGFDAAIVASWRAFLRLTVVFSVFPPLAFQYRRAILQTVSLASEPVSPKKTRLKPSGVTSASLAASSAVGWVEVWEKVLS